MNSKLQFSPSHIHFQSQNQTLIPKKIQVSGAVLGNYRVPTWYLKPDIFALKVLRRKKTSQKILFFSLTSEKVKGQKIMKKKQLFYSLWISFCRSH